MVGACATRMMVWRRSGAGLGGQQAGDPGNTLDD